MRVALFGATGMIGSRIIDESLRRGHEVTAIVRNVGSRDRVRPGVSVELADVLEPGAVTDAVVGHEVVISSVGPRPGEPLDIVVDAAKSLIEALRHVPGTRLLIVGGAGSLEVAPGRLLLDSPEFPDEFRPIAEVHREALEIIRRSDIDWTFVSPPAFIEPGERGTPYRVGQDQLLVDDSGVSRISAEDFAVAVLDEIEQPRHRRKRFTVAY